MRRAYDDACHAMAEGFASALVKAKWACPGAPHQTEVFGEFVGGHATPVAYFLVDALRFEMGAELGERLPGSFGGHASGTPSVPCRASPRSGMAALQPGAAASFTVVEEGGKLGARIDAAFLPDLRRPAEVRGGEDPDARGPGARRAPRACQPRSSRSGSKVPRSWSSGRRRSTTRARPASPSRRAR